MQKHNNSIDPDYLALVSRLPLIPIRNQKQAEAAIAMVDKLLLTPEAELTQGQSDYLEVLSHQIADYEEEQFSDELEDIRDIDLLDHLMEAHDMSASDLGRLLGNRELGSKLLRGERELSKANILTLAKHFNVSSGLFLRPKSDAARKKPHLLRVFSAEEQRLITVRFDSLQPSGKRIHAALLPNLKKIATKLYWRVGHHIIPKLQDWITGFCFDIEPEKELIAWLLVAEAFESLHLSHFKKEKQRESLRVLLLISINTVDVESQTKLSAAFVKKLRTALEHAEDSIDNEIPQLVA